MSVTDITHIHDFLLCKTPPQWLEEADKPDNLQVLLCDHANCELKAATTAQSIMWKYRDSYVEKSTRGADKKRAGDVGKKDLLFKLSQLAREELLHFEQVLEFMAGLDVPYGNLTPSRYASEMRKAVSASEPHKLVDTLIVGAIIEARSCERFAALAPRFIAQEKTAALGRYYVFLLKSESRHYEDYLSLARLYSPNCIDERIAEFLEKERLLIETEDTQFRFHSGVPI